MRLHIPFNHLKLVLLRWLISIPFEFYFGVGLFLVFSPSMVTAQSSELPKMLQQWKQSKSGPAKVDLTLQIGLHYITKPGESREDLSQARNYTNYAQKASRKINYREGEAQGLVLTAQIFREGGDLVQGKKFAQHAINLFIAARAKKYAANAYLEMANYYSIDSLSGLEQKSILYEKAVRHLENSDPNTLKLAHTIKFSGELLTLLGKDSQGLERYQQALTIYKRIGHGELQHVLTLIGEAYSYMGDPVKALEYQLKALETARKYNDNSMTLCAIYGKLSYTYRQLNQIENSLHSLKQARLVAKKNNDLESFYRISSRLSILLIMNNHYKQGITVAENALRTLPSGATDARLVFTTTLLSGTTKQGNLKKAKIYLNTVLSLINLDGIAIDQKANAYHSIIEYYRAVNDYTSVSKYFSLYKPILLESKDLISRINLEQYTFKIDSAKGDYFKALKQFKRYIYFSDSLAELNRSKEAAKLESLFKLKEKNIEIAAKAKNIDLLKNQSKIQQKMISTQRLSRNLLFVAVMLLIFLLALAFISYVDKRKANTVLSAKQIKINQQNESLVELVTEREWLLKEIHHRVKNNLQIIISLLNAQSAYLSDPEMIRLIDESQHRLQAISIIHQKLYQDENLSGIELSNYINELADYLQESFSTKGKIKFLIRIEPTMLNISQAVPLGLMINEALTNSLKYAFPNASGEIKIDLQKLENTELLLCIKDNGIGLDSDFDVSRSSTLGMKLIKGLSKQLKAELSITSDEGVRISWLWRATFINNRNEAKDQLYLIK